MDAPQQRKSTNHPLLSVTWTLGPGSYVIYKLGFRPESKKARKKEIVDQPGIRPLKIDCFFRNKEIKRKSMTRWQRIRRGDTGMGWLWLVGSIKLNVSFAKEPYKRDNILQKRPIIYRSYWPSPPHSHGGPWSHVFLVWMKRPGDRDWDSTSVFWVANILVNKNIQCCRNANNSH